MTTKKPGDSADTKKPKAKSNNSNSPWRKRTFCVSEKARKVFKKNEKLGREIE